MRVPSAARGVLVALALTSACSQRRCGGETDTSSRVDAGRADGTLGPDRARCETEVSHGAVATVPGLGALDALIPACGSDDTIAVFALRGHTLSRLVRARTPGSTFRLADSIATGADRLGPVGTGSAASLGPLAWRSPTVLLDEDVGDEWWVAWLEARADGGLATVHRGSAVMPPGVEGLGIIAPIARRDTNVEVLATIARVGSNPRLVRATVPTGGNELVPFTHDPPALADGELKAWEPATHTALVFAMEADDHAVLRAMNIPEDPASSARTIGTVPLTRSHVLVIPTGVPLASGAVAFAYSEFDVVQQGAGPCLALDPALCVTPGPVRILIVDARGARPSDVAPSGLVDSFARERDGMLLVLHVEGTGETRTQRATRFDTTGLIARPTRWRPPTDAVPPLDRPTLVRCDDELWLGAEVLLDASDAGRSNETAVMVLPAACLIENDTGG